jgi:CBS domain-containing protein
MRVSDLMTNEVISIRDEASLGDAVRALSDNHISGLAVVDRHDRLVGVVSVIDVLAAQAEADDDEARARVLRETSVRDIMSTRPLIVSPDVSVREAALEMEFAGVHRLFVVLEGKPVGVISRSDVSRGHALGRL